MRAPVAGLGLLTLLLAGCGTAAEQAASDAPTTGPGAGQTVTIGAADFGENIALAEIYRQKLAADGFSATVRQLSSREVIEPALESGDLTVVPEYLATVTAFLNAKQNGPDAPSVISPDPEETLAALQPLAEEAGLVFYDYAEAQDQNAYVVTREFAEANDISTVSDLAAYSQTTPVTLAGTPECRERQQCYLGLAELYGMQFTPEYINIDLSGFQGRERLESGDADVAVFLSSDGGLDESLVVLEDDKGLNASDNIIPAVSGEASTPELEASLNEVQAALSQEELIELNRRVNNERVPAAQAAEQFLQENDLL